MWFTNRFRSIRQYEKINFSIEFSWPDVNFYYNSGIISLRFFLYDWHDFLWVWNNCYLNLDILSVNRRVRQLKRFRGVRREFWIGIMPRTCYRLLRLVKFSLKKPRISFCLLPTDIFLVKKNIAQELNCKKSLQTDSTFNIHRHENDCHPSISVIRFFYHLATLFWKKNNATCHHIMQNYPWLIEILKHFLVRFQGLPYLHKKKEEKQELFTNVGNLS